MAVAERDLNRIGKVKHPGGEVSRQRRGDADGGAFRGKARLRQRARDPVAMGPAEAGAELVGELPRRGGERHHGGSVGGLEPAADAGHERCAEEGVLLLPAGVRHPGHQGVPRRQAIVQAPESVATPPAPQGRDGIHADIDPETVGSQRRQRRGERHGPAVERGVISPRSGAGSLEALVFPAREIPARSAREPAPDHGATLQGSRGAVGGVVLASAAQPAASEAHPGREARPFTPAPRRDRKQPSTRAHPFGVARVIEGQRRPQARAGEDRRGSRLAGETGMADQELLDPVHIESAEPGGKPPRHDGKALAAVTGLREGVQVAAQVRDGAAAVETTNPGRRVLTLAQDGRHHSGLDRTILHGLHRRRPPLERDGDMDPLPRPHDEAVLPYRLVPRRLGQDGVRARRNHGKAEFSVAPGVEDLCTEGLRSGEFEPRLRKRLALRDGHPA